MPDLHRLTATDLRALMRDRLISAREVTEAALARIDDVNQGLNAVVGRMDAEALAAASEAFEGAEEAQVAAAELAEAAV